MKNLVITDGNVTLVSLQPVFNADGVQIGYAPMTLIVTETFKVDDVMNLEHIAITATSFTGVAGYRGVNLFKPNVVDVAVGGTLNIGKYYSSEFGSFTVEPTGNAVIGLNSVTDVKGQISVLAHPAYGSGRVSITVATAPDVAGIVWYPKEGPAPTGNEYWVNGTPSRHF